MGSVAASIAVFLIALAAALAFLYFGLRWVSKNEDQTRTALSKVGLQPLDPITPVDPIVGAPPAVAPPLTNASPAPIVQSPPTPVVQVSPSPVGSGVALVSLSGQRFELNQGDHLVSRDAGQICLAGESTVSRQHARVTVNGASIMVSDLGSTNGTFVNGARISADTPLNVGDNVQFGAVTMRLQV
ncbi:MAG: FHA domain-containing protein [Fimbriimonadaceae bacterium]